MSTLVRTARTTGVFYLVLAITGLVGYLLIRKELFVADDPGQTLANLTDQETLARAGIVVELLVVTSQALAAMWFLRLFRGVDTFAAGAIAAFGLVNAVAILGSAGCLATAVTVATDPIGDAATTVQLLYLVSGSLWDVGGIFFGLWLIPMGWCVLRSGWMPRALGWFLVVGGVGYVAATFLRFLVAESATIADGITMPATIGEFWIIGYLVVLGVRRPKADEPAPAAAAPIEQ